jgi:rhamnose transport system substrate-binding protein
MRISSHLSSIIVAACVASTTVFAVGADFTIGFISKLDTDPYFKATGEDAAEAQKEIGGKSLLVAPSTATGEAQIPFINNLVSKKVNVIAISAADSNSVAPVAVRTLRKAISLRIGLV